jgi:hypothetical protein
MGDDQAAAASFGVMYQMLLHDGLIFTVGLANTSARWPREATRWTSSSACRAMPS